MILESFFVIGLFAPGLFLLQIMKVKARNRIEHSIQAYIISLVVMFVILYIGGIMMSYIIASYVYTLLVILSIFYLSVKCVRNLPTLAAIRQTISEITLENCVLWTSIISLLSVYVVILLSRALLDSDVVQFYLPFAREIVRGNGFTYSTGFDYNTFLKPIGVSVIYAWTYVTSGSLMSESFRLMPLVPVILMILLTYSIAVELTDSSRIGTIAALTFILLPIHDRLLTYNAFYPDVYYYPLIFFVILGLLKYSDTKNTHSLLWIGCAFGIAGLLKAQTILFFIAFLLCFMIIEIKDRKLVFFFCLLTPFAILIPNMLAKAGSEGASFIIGAESIALMLFASLVIGFLYFIIEPRISPNVNSNKDENTETSVEKKPSSVRAFAEFVLRCFWVIIPFIVLSGLWYLNNLVQYGSLIYTSSVEIPNYGWAIEILNTAFQPGNGVNFTYYFPYFFFLFIDPAIMGYVWLVPLLIGTVLSWRLQSKRVALLMLLTVVAVALVFSQIAYNINPYDIAVVNPRDLVPIAPLLAVCVSHAFCSFTDWLHNESFSKNRIILPSSLALYFGLLSYLHSVYLYFGTIVLPGITQVISKILMLFGLTLQQTSYQMSPNERVAFASIHSQTILVLSLAIALPLLLVAIMKRLNSLSIINQEALPMLRDRYNQILRLVRWSSISDRQRRFMTLGAIFVLVLSVIVVPRGVILAAQGGPYESQEYQLSRYYGPLYELLVDHGSVIHGDILTYYAPEGLPYYIEDVNIIDLRYAANLAYLMECFNSSSIYDSAICFKQKGIRHLLFDPSTISNIDDALNNTLSSIITNSNYSKISQTYGRWILYDLGPFEVVKTVVSPTDWVLDSRYTSGPIVFDTNETGVFLELSIGGTDDRIAIANYAFPHINFSNYEYLSINISGSSNARVLFRFYLVNGTSADVAYWSAPQQIKDFSFKIQANYLARGDAYISVISSDGLPASVVISEISFIKLVPISLKVFIPLNSWSVDFRYTAGSFSYYGDEKALFLGLSLGNVGDRLTIVTEEFPECNLSEYNYLIVRILGSGNARLLFRVYLEDGSSLDFAYWVEPNYFLDLIPIPAAIGAFRGQAFIGLISDDGSSCSIRITEMSLIQTNGIVN